MIVLADKKFGVNLSKIKTKIETSNYKGELKLSQVFSFLHTQQIASSNPTIKQDTDYKAFEKNFSQIQQQFDIPHPQNPEMKL